MVGAVESPLGRSRRYRGRSRVPCPPTDRLGPRAWVTRWLKRLDRVTPRAVLIVGIPIVGLWSTTSGPASRRWSSSASRSRDWRWTASSSRDWAGLRRTPRSSPRRWRPRSTWRSRPRESRRPTNWRGSGRLAASVCRATSSRHLCAPTRSRRSSKAPWRCRSRGSCPRP